MGAEESREISRTPMTIPEVNTLRVSEIYATILGESTFAGWPGVILRLTGCPLRCVWCDSTHAYEGGEALSLAEIVDRVAGFDLPLVLVTGGEPLAQVGARFLISMLLSRGFRVLIETGGGVSIEGVDPRACIILDIKCPGSGMSERQVWENLNWLKPNDEVKFVIASRADYEWARGVLKRTELTGRQVVHFAPVESEEAAGGITKRELAEWIVADRLPVRLNLQQHVWIWGRGVHGV